MERTSFERQLRRAFKLHPVVGILGPRQCGKTTLSRVYAQSHAGPCHIFDLENPEDLTRLQNPMLALSERQGLIIIDEIQRVPELFPVLRVLVDQPNPSRQFLILGSASRELIKQSSESLAGRIQYLELTPFNLEEAPDLNRLWSRGGYPRSFLAEDEVFSFEWRKSYIKTFLEQDIPALGISIPANTLRRFWSMLAHYHGGILNLSEIGVSFGASHTTIRNYLDILSGTFMVRQLQPWFQNIGKRQVKNPKIYLRDSGILHCLLGVPNFDQLELNPKLGSSWEGFALEEIIRHHQAEPEDCYFWRTHAGTELDLLLVQNGKKRGFEFKYSDTAKPTKSMKLSQADLELDELWVITPRGGQAPLADGIRIAGLSEYCAKLVK